MASRGGQNAPKQELRYRSAATLVTTGSRVIAQCRSTVPPYRFSGQKPICLAVIITPPLLDGLGILRACRLSCDLAFHDLVAP